jgi:hypothetical protein
MKTVLLTLTLVLSANCVVLAADTGKAWYETMLQGLKTKVQKKLESRNRVSAVAAVRGAKQGEDARALYWKGGVSDAARKKLDAERKQLADAVQLAVDGDNAGAKVALGDFIKNNPDSLYLPDAKEALEKLPADAPASSVKPEAAKTEAVEPAAEKPAAVKAEEKPSAPAAGQKAN